MRSHNDDGGADFYFHLCLDHSAIMRAARLTVTEDAVDERCSAAASASDTMSCTQLFWVTCTIYMHWCLIDYFPFFLIHHFNVLFVFNYSL